MDAQLQPDRETGDLLPFAVPALALPSFAQVRRSATPATEHKAAPQIPYTAEYRATMVQTLSNGSTITRNHTEIRAVDSQGRIMLQTTVPHADETPIVHTIVTDPVAHTRTEWDSRSKKATVYSGSNPTDLNCLAALVGSPSHPTARASQQNSTTEQLGTDTIQGIEARGTRTTTIPVGEIGNDEPLVRTYEIWGATNPGFRHLTARSINDDPRIGKFAKELTSLTQGEPDASVFSPPSDYEIVTNPAGGSGCPADSSATASPNEPRTH
jgi:hypothetical protein